MLAELHPRLPTLIERAAAWAGRRRLAVASAGACAIAATLLIACLTRWSSEVPLFATELRPAQVTEVANALTLWGEPFHANTQGTQLYVAGLRRSDLLLRLMLAGLPRRYVPTSSDVLDDQSNALTPQSVIDDRRRTGIEGDLVSGLRKIAGVADASVVLPPASHDPLDDPSADAPPSAAVQLVLDPGAQLGADAIAGIRRFVASAYPGLSPDRVTVVDSSGAVMGTPAQVDAATAKERRVQTAVQSALDAVFGPGCAVVRVSIRTVGTEQQTQTTRVIPGGPLSADDAHERGSEAGKSYDKERTIRRYAFDTVSERRTSGADVQARISVAVFLDARRTDAAASGTIASLVRAAAGADLKAGDDVVVQAVPFATPATTPNPVAAARAVSSQALAPTVVACALALFGFASLPRAWRAATPSVRVQLTPERPTDPLADATLRSLASESPQAAAYVLAGLERAHRERVLDLCSTQRRSAIRAFLERHA